MRPRAQVLRCRVRPLLLLKRLCHEHWLIRRSPSKILVRYLGRAVPRCTAQRHVAIRTATLWSCYALLTALTYTVSVTLRKRQSRRQVLKKPILV